MQLVCTRQLLYCPQLPLSGRFLSINSTIHNASRPKLPHLFNYFLLLPFLQRLYPHHQTLEYNQRRHYSAHQRLTFPVCTQYNRPPASKQSLTNVLNRVVNQKSSDTMPLIQSIATFFLLTWLSYGHGTFQFQTIYDHHSKQHRVISSLFSQIFYDVHPHTSSTQNYYLKNKFIILTFYFIQQINDFEF